MTQRHVFYQVVPLEKSPRRVPRIFWDATLASGSFSLAVFLLVIDELFSLAFYCRTNWTTGYDSSSWCGYPYPVGPVLYGYAPWEVAFVGIMLSVLAIGVSLYRLGGLRQ